MNDMAEMIAAPAEQPETTRTFFRTDYARFARDLRRARTVRGTENTLKPQAQQDVVDQAAAALAAVFTADSESASDLPYAFDSELFTTSTRPLAPAGEDEDE